MRKVGREVGERHTVAGEEGGEPAAGAGIHKLPNRVNGGTPVGKDSE